MQHSQILLSLMTSSSKIQKLVALDSAAKDKKN